MSRVSFPSAASVGVGADRRASSSITVWLKPRTSSKAVTALLLRIFSNLFTPSIKDCKRVLPRKSAYFVDLGTFTVDNHRWNCGLVNASATNSIVFLVP